MRKLVQQKEKYVEDEKVRVITAADKLLSDCIKNFDNDVKNVSFIRRCS